MRGKYLIKCSMCGEVKDVSEYYANKTKRFGKSTECNDCRKKLNQDKRRKKDGKEIG